ncbi:MAG: 50S ribosomal protein L3 [bacterium]
MSLGLMGKKVGMTQIFQENGDVIPVTVIKAGPCAIYQKKTKEKDNYCALQVGFEPVKETRVNRPRLYHMKKIEREPVRYLREFRIDEADQDNYAPGQEITVDIFKEGDYVDISGFSKGKGFAGVIKRHNFHGAPGAHGTHTYRRHGGSVGASSTPSRVFKNKKMPGRMGNCRITIQNLQIVQVQKEHNCIIVKGSVPGPNNGLLLIKAALKKG